MAATGRKAEESARTRTAILDATEAIMREEGYAAVSARRVSERAGVNLGLIHYHFGTMDDLFLSLFARTEDQYFGRYVAAVTCDDPLRALWERHIDPPGNELIIEFMALANHRKTIRREIARSCERVRSLQVSVLSRVLAEAGVDAADWPPPALALLMAGAARALMMEAAVGVSAGHAETLALIERCLEELRGGRPRSAPQED